MRLWSELRERFHALFSRNREDRELDEELNFHLDMEAANHLHDGLTPEESRRAGARVVRRHRAGQGGRARCAWCSSAGAARTR